MYIPGLIVSKKSLPVSESVTASAIVLKERPVETEAAPSIISAYQNILFWGLYRAKLGNGSTDP